MKKQEKRNQYKMISPKIVTQLIALAFLFSCGSDDTPPSDTTNPVAKINSALVKDLDGDGKVNDVEISATGTDNVGVRNMVVSVGGQPAVKIGDKYVVSDLAAGNHTAKVEVTDTSGRTASAVKNFAIEMANVAPEGILVFNDFLENQAIGSVVGTFTVSDANGDNLTASVTEGGENFELVLQAGQTNVYDIKTKKVFDYETANPNGYDLKTKVIDQELFKEMSAKAEVLDGDDGPETFEQDDIVVQRTIHSGDYTFNPTMLRDGVPTIVKTDKADNDPNTPNWVYEIVDIESASGKEDLAKIEADVEGTPRGTDATAFNLAPIIVDGYGIGGFRLTTQAEREANDGSYLVNERGEFISGEGFQKTIEYFKEKFGLTGSVDFKNPPYGDRNLQNARACVVMIAAFLTQTGADEAETVQKCGAITHQIITSMTDDELASFQNKFEGDSFFEPNGGWHTKE
jgi:hypothetical protein